MKQIGSAIFRTRPPISTDDAPHSFLGRKKQRTEDKILHFHPDVLQPSADPDWDLVEAAYDSIFSLLSSDGPDALLLECFFDESFVQKLLDNLVDSCDPREAKSVGKLLPLIWLRSNELKTALWGAATQTLSRFLSNSRAHIGNGIWELLFFLASKIEELPRPNQLSLFETLVRLHKPTCFAQYNQPLRLCFTKILEEDDDLTDSVICGILKYWPTKLPSKEALMLREIRDIIIDVPETKVVCSIGPLFRRLDNCLRSEHYLVVTRALEVLNTPALRKIAEMNRTMISVFSGGLEVATEHWNMNVMEEAIEVQRIYREIEQNGSRKRKGLKTVLPKTKLRKLQDQSVKSSVVLLQPELFEYHLLGH